MLDFKEYAKMNKDMFCVSFQAGNFPSSWHSKQHGRRMVTIETWSQETKRRLVRSRVDLSICLGNKLRSQAGLQISVEFLFLFHVLINQGRTTSSSPQRVYPAHSSPTAITALLRSPQTSRLRTSVLILYFWKGTGTTGCGSAFRAQAASEKNRAFILLEDLYCKALFVYWYNYRQILWSKI